MSWADTLGNMRTLDRWRTAIGLEYEAEKLHSPPARRGALRVPTAPAMKYGRVEGIDKPVARLVIDADFAGFYPEAREAMAIFDDYFEPRRQRVRHRTSTAAARRTARWASGSTAVACATGW